MESPIRIGEINTYSPSALSGFMVTYRNGIDLFLSEVNAGNGVLGRPLEVVFRDDGLDKVQAAQIAESLLLDDKVDLIAGTFTSDVGLAVAEVADRLKRVFIATEPRTDALIWDQGSRYVFRIRTSQSMMISMLASGAANMTQRRWTILAPSYGGGIRIARVARELLQSKRPDIIFGADQHFELGKLDAQVVDRLMETNPEVVLSVVYGSDLLPFVRLGKERGIFERVQMISPLGDPEYLSTTGAETPEGWLVLGYPGDKDSRPAHMAFVQAYRKRFRAEPDAAALIGYMGFQAIAAGIERAGSLETEALVEGFRGLRYESPVGPVLIRRGDHQATVGNWIGKTALENGRPTVVESVFLDGADFLPTEVEAAKRRPASARQ